ncbi:MAG: HD domain-containing phosphohydrolase [Aliarcobacter sp.]|nr:HD domain-containing phosphohydrolase [Aliarcobacter sp.]
MTLSLNKFLFSISFALDLAESEIKCTSLKHSKRVAYICLKMAYIMGLSDEEKFDLCSYALMHDNGLIESYCNFSNDFSQEKTKDYFELVNFSEHCIIGENNIKEFPFLTHQENIILYHHEYFDGSGLFGKKSDDIPLFAQLISFADCIDTNFDLMSICFDKKESILKFVNENENKLFSSQIVLAYKELSQSFLFWGDLEYFDEVNPLEKILPDFNIDVSLEIFLLITKIFSKIIDGKSKFTAKHSIDLEKKSMKLVEYFNLDYETKLKIQIAANLHDIGKLGTPNAILDKEGSLTDEELFEIKKHAYLTHTILSKLDNFTDISKWASAHHEKLDGTGYPFGLTSNELGLEERIVSCLDFYQALVEDRPYRKSMSHDDAIRILRLNLNSYEIDINIINAIEKVFA